MGDVSEESLLDYFYSAGGKVKNSDLMKTYKPFIGHKDMELRAKYREEFKQIIDRIAVVKSENGEKYLVLKKRYRQQKQDSETEPGTDRQASPARPWASAQWDGSGVSSLSSPQMEPDLQPEPAKGAEERKPSQVTWCGRGPSITVTEAPEQEHMQEDQHTERKPSPSVSEEPLVHSNGENELDRDSGSKSESEEQEEECTGSMGSTQVALDPVEKEWIYSAACGRLSDLAQLLQQEPSLANKKDFTSGFTALHWAAKHGKEDMATMMANAGADVNTKSHGGYTPLHIAALHGHRNILELLIGTYDAKQNLRDYSGHLACQYLNIREPTEDDRAAPEEIQFPEFHVAQARDRSRNRKLTSLFQSKKKWGSAEELAPVEEERVALAPHQLIVPAFRPRKFSR
ncbi:ankyrin repeat domain-containing protein SOWAHC isoform X1 [Salmo trutta]|uniref:ankyrin repeat domain-containing protein SOWAHC isoform X1 n=1 Tax=Salmo trutta TaxID=8032 RepID=UPI001131D6CE|nr:ankyrin repeat domain-containing protein SOWAHC-like isoform X1 [Salmo trutta]XP_029574674.1 ankyrin repeat domain-containing protein SOWAHC-like isoform X1 [Salmo trutta]